MTSLRLLHLTFAGTQKQRAQVTFDARLTVVYGASDTGKSFVTEAIDYMLGARHLNVIPEAEGYSQILLGIEMPSGAVVTLMRTPRSSSVNVYNADLRDVIYQRPDLVLSAHHSTKSSRNLSRYLLGQLGLDGTLISTNDSGNTKLLSFRDLLHLCLISETRMVSKVSPVLRTSGANGQTAHKSALKLLLTGSGEQQSSVTPNAAQRRVHKGKITLLDELIIDLQRQLTGNANQSELEQQLRRILASLESGAVSLREVSERHAQAATQRATLTVTLGHFAERLAEVNDLLGRFGLLRQQYESDLDRLVMVNEAGSLLGYFNTGTCVFCGAEPEHQKATHGEHDSIALHTAVATESTKTRHLLADLLVTIDDLQAQKREIISRQAGSSVQAAAVDREIARIEEQELRPLESEAAALMSARSEVERELGLHNRIDELEDVRQSLIADGAQPGGRPSGSIPSSVVVGFERAIQSALEAWHVRRGGEVNYDQYSAELSVGERERAGHGKGMRAVLHAAFAVALGDFSIRHGYSHPGFVVLDSPLVTYREPGTQDVALPASVKHQFYRSLLADFAGQAIIVENVDPPADVVERAQVYMFSRETHGQRFGFFPVDSGRSESSAE